MYTYRRESWMEEEQEEEEGMTWCVVHKFH